MENKKVYTAPEYEVEMFTVESTVLTLGSGIEDIPVEF